MRRGFKVSYANNKPNTVSTHDSEIHHHRSGCCDGRRDNVIESAKLQTQNGKLKLNCRLSMPNGVLWAALCSLIRWFLCPRKHAEANHEKRAGRYDITKREREESRAGVCVVCVRCRL